MAAIPGTPEYQPSFPQKVWGFIARRAPYYIGRAIQFIMYGLFQVFRFIIQMFRDAIGQ
jgi:hypothetical protein